MKTKRNKKRRKRVRMKPYIVIAILSTITIIGFTGNKDVNIASNNAQRQEEVFKKTIDEYKIVCREEEECIQILDNYIMACKRDYFKSRLIYSINREPDGSVVLDLTVKDSFSINKKIPKL